MVPTTLPAIGEVVTIWLGNMERRAKILAYDDYCENVYVKWQYQNLGCEWWPTRRL